MNDIKCSEEIKSLPKTGQNSRASKGFSTNQVCTLWYMIRARLKYITRWWTNMYNASCSNRLKLSSKIWWKIRLWNIVPARFQKSIVISRIAQAEPEGGKVMTRKGNPYDLFGWKATLRSPASSLASSFILFSLSSFSTARSFSSKGSLSKLNRCSSPSSKVKDGFSTNSEVVTTIFNSA